MQEELEYAEQMFHDLSVHNNALTTELNEAKHLLVKAGALEFPDVLPVHVFCEVRLPAPAPVRPPALDCNAASSDGQTHSPNFNQSNTRRPTTRCAPL